MSEEVRKALRRCSRLNHQVNIRWNKDSKREIPEIIFSGICQVSFLVFELWVPLLDEYRREYRDNCYSSPVSPFKINWLEPVDECFEKQFFSHPSSKTTCSTEPTPVSVPELRDVLETLVSFGIISVAVTNYPGIGVEFSALGLRRYIFEKKEPTIDSVKYTKNYSVIGLINSLAAASSKHNVKLTLTMDADTPLLLQFKIKGPYPCTLKTRLCHLDD